MLSGRSDRPDLAYGAQVLRAELLNQTQRQKALNQTVIYYMKGSRNLELNYDARQKNVENVVILRLNFAEQL